MKGEIDLTGCVIVPKGVCIYSSTDDSGKITGTNPEFLMYSGFEYSDLNGKNHNIIRHPDMPQSLFYILWDELKKSRISCPTEVVVFVKNKTNFGGFYWVLATARATKYHSNGRPSLYMSNRVGVYDVADIQWLEGEYKKIKMSEARRLGNKELSQHQALSMAKNLIQGEEYEKLIKKYR
jgi:PAS domain S-box-containing protein